MSIGDLNELEQLREVGSVVHSVLEAMKEQVRPGITTGELDSVAERVLEANGARHAPQAEYGFPGFSCISINDEAVHGIPGERVIRPGDIVKLDVVAEKDGYVADAAITVPVGPVSSENERLSACVSAAFAAAMEVARAGNRVADIGRAIEREVRRRGFWVLRELAGHGTGRRIHEAPTVPNYGTAGSPVLTEGLVIAVEPIISTRKTHIVEDPDGWTLRTADRSIAAHHEHTIVITRGLPVLLTAA